MLKRIGWSLLAVLFFSIAAHAQRAPIETTMIEAPATLVIETLRLVPQVSGCTGHCVGLTWNLSIDDDAGATAPVNCTTAAACSQSMFRASGACTSTTTFGSPIATLSATAVSFTDSSVKVGQSYCYAMTFTLNSLSSALSNTVVAVILPAPQTSLGEKSQ